MCQGCPSMVKGGTYIDPNVNTTLKITFCRSSRVNFQTIGIGRARIIKSAVVRCQSSDLCEVTANVHTRNVHHAIANIESFFIDPMCRPDTHIPGVVRSEFLIYNTWSNSPICSNGQTSEQARKHGCYTISYSAENTSPP